MGRLRITFFASTLAVAFACSSAGSDDAVTPPSGTDGGGADATTSPADAATGADTGVTTNDAASDGGDGGCVLGPANCGACGVDCTNGSCKGGICTLVDTNAIGGFYGPEAISIVGKSVYVAVAGQPTEIGRCPTNGCGGTGPTVLLSFDGGTEEPLGISVDETSGTLLWASYESNPSGGVHKLPIDGGASVHLNAGHPSNYTSDVAVIGTSVVWGADDSPGGLLTCPLAGCPSGGPTVIGGIDAYARGFIVFGGDKIAVASQGALQICTGVACTGGPHLVADSQGLGIGAIAAAPDGKTLYWGATYPAKAIMYGSIEGDAGSGNTLVPQGQAPSSMLIAGDTLYWTLSGTDPNPSGASFPLTPTSDGAVRKCKLPACSPVVDVAPNAAAPRSLATDGIAIYWVEVGVAGNLAGAGAVKKAPL